MAVIFVLVIAMFWVSLQKGALGTPSAIYTLANYREVFADPFIYRRRCQHVDLHRHGDVGRLALRPTRRMACGANHAAGEDFDSTQS